MFQTSFIFDSDSKFIPQESKSEGFDSYDRPSNLKLDSNRQYFSLCDCEIWWMTSKNNRALLQHYVKLCASFPIHWWIKTGVTVQKRWIRVEIGDILSHVTLKFDGWTWKTTWHLSCAASSFVHHFIAIVKFKLELKSRSAQFGSKSRIFLAVWPWNLMDRFRPEILNNCFDFIWICVSEIEWGHTSVCKIWIKKNFVWFAVSFDLASLGPISVKHSLDLWAIALTPVISMASWMKHDGKSELKVFLFMISFNVSHIFWISFS